MSTSSGDERRTAEPMASVRRTLAIGRPAGGRLALASLLGACAIAASIGLMATSAWLISRAAQHPEESALALAIVLVQFFGLSRGFFRYAERLVGHDAAFRLLADLRVRVFRALEARVPGGLPAGRGGDLLARVVSDVDSEQDLLLRVVPPFAIAIGVGAATVALAWWLLPAAGMVIGAALLAAATIVPWLSGVTARRRESGQATARGELAAAVVDLVEGAPELVVFGATGIQTRTIGERDARLTAIAASSAGTAGLGLALTTLLTGLAAWGAVVVGVPAVHTGRLSGVLLAVLALIPLAAFELVQPLPIAMQSLQRARRAAARIFAVTDGPVPVSDPVDPGPLPAAPYRLEAAALCATYPGCATPAVREVDLRLHPGRRVAVVGPSGAGKSTLASALVRFLPYEGSVCLNGVELRDLGADSLRNVVQLVGQDAHMFDTSLAENLRVGRRRATDAELRDVLARVGLGGWLAELPAGLLSEVGRGGSRLSGGQRQRVAIARALLADPPVLILDEPVEHLDPRSADAMTGDLLALTEGRSVLLITHRLAGLEAVDEIMVMDAGAVVERGTHDELLASAGRYSALWWDEMRAERDRTLGEVPLMVDAPRGRALEGGIR